MNANSIMAHVTWILLFGSLIIYVKSEPMAKPERPRVFNSAEQFKKYLEDVKEYYNLNARPRYGKRSTEPFSRFNSPVNALKMILDMGRQNSRELEIEKDLSSRLDMNRPQSQDDARRLTSFLAQYYRDIQ